MLVTENSTQSSEPLIERSSPTIHYSQEDNLNNFHRTDQNYAYKHESLEDNESTDDGGFKINPDTSNVIRSIRDSNNTSNDDQNAFYRSPEGDFVSASDV